MPDYLDPQVIAALSDPTVDPHDPNLQKPNKTGDPAKVNPADDPSYQAAVKDQPWLSPDDPNIPKVTPPSDTPGTSDDFFDLVHNGEKIQVSRDKGLKLMQQAFNLDAKAKDLDAEATRRAEQQIGKLVREGKLVIPQPDKPGPVGPQIPPTPSYPTPPQSMGTVPPQGSAPYGQPYSDPRFIGQGGPTVAPQVDEFGFPIQAPQVPQQIQVPQYSPEVMALQNQMAQMQGTIESLGQVLDQNTVSNETRRLASIMREAQPKMPRMRAKEVLLEIAKMGDSASNLSDIDILQMCKKSHDENQQILDGYLTEYFETKKREAAKNAPSSAYLGSGVPIPEKPIKTFEDADKAATELLKNIV